MSRFMTPLRCSELFLIHCCMEFWGVYTGASSLLVKVKRGHPVSMILLMSLSLFLWKCMVKVCIFLWVVVKILPYGFIGVFNGFYCTAEELLMCSGLLLVVCFSWTQIK